MGFRGLSSWEFCTLQSFNFFNLPTFGERGKNTLPETFSIKKNPTTFLSNVITDRFQLESCCFYFNFIKGANKGYPRHHNKITLTVKLHY